MISETLGTELGPLGLRVSTVMLGQVSTQMYANPRALHLPEGSPYEKIAGTIAWQTRGDFNLNNEPADVVARKLARDAISGRVGKIWRGGHGGHRIPDAVAIADEAF